MATDIEIVNLALSKIGEESITSFNDDSTPARLAKLTYIPGRDAVLRDHLWNFATKRAQLAALADTPLFGFDFQYPLPTDCIRVLFVGENENLPQVPYQVEDGKILTNETAPLQVKYTRRVTEAEKFDPMFVDALATYLASEWAERITGSTTLREQLTQLYSLKLQQARSMDGQEGPPGVIRAFEWIFARF